MILSYMYPIRTGTKPPEQSKARRKRRNITIKGSKGRGGKGGVQRGSACSRRLNRGAEANRRSGATGPGVRLRALEAMRQGGAGPALWAHYIHNDPAKAPTFKTGIRFSRGKNRHAPLPPPLFKICLIPNQSYTGWSFFMFLTMEPGVVPKLDGQIRFL